MKSGLKVVRWIMVVTLGCSLGLLFVYAVLSTRTYTDNQNIAIVHRFIPAEGPYKVSQDGIEKELQRVVASQLSAFREDDYPRAFEFAASSIRAQLSLPAFERMVKNSYPGIAKSSAVQFGIILDNGDHALVNVTTIGTRQTHHYQYVLQHERTGWKVAGVAEVRSVGTTV
jgi:hypothetical protein